jgi:copper chaperone NosL
MTARFAQIASGVLIAAALTACQDRTEIAPTLQEITRDAVAEYCGMSLTEHRGPKAQIFLRSESAPHWFASVHDAFAYTMLAEEPKDIAAIYVNDMAQAKNWVQPEPGTWIEARKALFVIESERRGGMDEDEAIPFSDAAAAEQFIKQHGGRLIRFSEMPKSYILSGDNSGDRIQYGASRERESSL